MKTILILLAQLSAACLWAANPFAYVANEYSASGTHGTISIVNYETRRVVKTIDLDGYPFDIAVSPNNAYVYVSLELTNSGSTFLEVIRTDTNAVSTRILLSAGPTTPVRMAVTVDGRSIWIVTDDSRLLVVDTTANKVIKNVPLPATFAGYPQWADILFSPDGKYAFVNGFDRDGSGEVVMMCAITGSTLASFTGFGNLPPSMALTPDGALLYVGDWTGGLTVISTVKRKVAEVIPLEFPAEIAITPDGKYAWVARSVQYGYLATVFTIFDTATNNGIRNVPGFVGYNVRMGFTPDGKYLYVPEGIFLNSGAEGRAINAYTDEPGLCPYSITVGHRPVAVAFLH